MSDTTKESNGRSKTRGGHCKRFWWIYLLVLIIIIVIVVPCILLVAVPKIAQQKVNAASLTVDSIIVSQTQSEELHIAMNATITTDGSTHATIAAFNGTMYLTDYDPVFQFATVQFPETSSDALVTVNVSQALPIEHMTELTIFNTYLLSKDKITVKIKGDTTVRVSGIARDYPVVFDKDIEMVGFNNFAGLTVTDPHVSITETPNFNATTTLPNPTIWTIEIGNTTLFTFFNESVVGTTNIENVVLRPGDNVFATTGNVDQGAILTGLGQQPYCQNGGALPFQLTGDTVVNNGQPLSYFADAFAATNLSVTIDIGAAIKNDVGYVVPCDPATSTSSAASTTSTST